MQKVEFSNGISRDFIQGKITVNEVDYSFNVILDSISVVDYTFDLINADVSNYSCSFKKCASDVNEIVWTDGTNRVFLRKKFISKH